MNKTIPALLVCVTIGSDAGGAIEKEYDFEARNDNEYIVVNVDKTEITDSSVLRLTIDVLFDDDKDDSVFSNSKADNPIKAFSELQQEKSGYLITLKLPIAKKWRQNGKRLKIKISADTAIPNLPSYENELPLSQP